MNALLRVWEEFVNIATIGNEFDKLVLSKVKPHYRGGKFFILVKDEFTKIWIEKNYLDRIISTFKYYDVEVELTIENEKAENVDEQKISSNLNLESKEEKSTRRFSSSRVKKTLEKEIEKVDGNVIVVEKVKNDVSTPTLSVINPKYTFDSFVVGPSNDLAYHSALNVSRYPGRNYNPLFIYGVVGIGKTHLLHAIANEVLKERKLKKVLYVTSEQFASEFFNSLNSRSIHSFRLKYREADILLIDDVQFFKASMKQVIDELFHTFNKLAHDKKQMVFTSDRTPRELDEIGDRMISRFEGGLVVEIKKPEFETRLKIVDMKLKAEGIEIDEKFKHFIANSIQSNVRSLESAVNRISAFINFKKGKLNIDVLKTLLKDLMETDQSGKEFVEIVYTIDDIVKAVAKYYNTDENSLVDNNKREDLILARQIAMYLAKKLTNLTFSQIGEKFGKVHSTAMRAYERVESLVKRDLVVKDQIKEIISILRKKKRII
ncbi:MAG: chromosomal replication initiator protein DnaA [Brevinematia bacterium]